ncbi:MAG: YbhB/YbcL family Raf kinase inhibitor-like protein [Anaerolineae bacterium]
MELVSGAFDSGDSIPRKYTCDGDNISPPLSWRFVPDEANALVLVCDDPDAPEGPFVHWVLYDLPVDIRRLEEDVPRKDRLASGGVQGRNGSGKIGYSGPCPPRGSAHHYYFRLYALDQSLNLPPGATRQQVLNRIEGHVLDNARLLGLYGRA